MKGCSAFLLSAWVSLAVDPQAYAVELEDVLDQSDTYQNKVVSLTGYVVPGTGKCTKMSCTSETPCCNICSAQPYLRDGDVQIAMTTGDQTLAVELICSWSDCDLPGCKRFQTGIMYTVQGTFRKGQSSGYYLDYTGSSVAEATEGKVSGRVRLRQPVADGRAIYDVRGRKILPGEAARGVVLSVAGVRRYVERAASRNATGRK